MFVVKLRTPSRASYETFFTSIWPIEDKQEL